MGGNWQDNWGYMVFDCCVEKVILISFWAHYRSKVKTNNFSKIAIIKRQADSKIPSRMDIHCEI